MLAVLADGRTGQARRAIQEVVARWRIALRVEDCQVARCWTLIVPLVRIEISRALLLQDQKQTKTISDDKFPA